VEAEGIKRRPSARKTLYVFLASRIIPGDNSDPMRFPLACLLLALLIAPLRAADEPFFKKNDVIALIGGEDMVVAAEDGYLETSLVRALPDYHLRFRSLAWEGDTVFEQHRDLNFPSWEEQLDKIGATVVICQFGEMESLAGEEKIPAFIEAYEKLLDRFSAAGKRRIVIVSPSGFDVSYESLNQSSFHPTNLEYRPGTKLGAQEKTLRIYTEAIQKLASARGYKFHQVFVGIVDAKFHRDGVHLDETGQSEVGRNLSEDLGVRVTDSPKKADAEQSLRKLVDAKNKLWFDYWRVQNWAFLAGDRTNQPSSRDWQDPSKRWFPAEREEFIPLVEGKEKEIDALAAKLK